MRILPAYRAEMDDPEPPPILGSWRNLYAAVLFWLAFLIALFYGFTRHFASLEKA